LLRDGSKIGRSNSSLKQPYPSPNPHRQKLKEKEKNSWNPCYISHRLHIHHLEVGTTVVSRKVTWFGWLELGWFWIRFKIIQNPKLELGLISRNWNWNWVKTRISVLELEPNMGPGSGTGTRIFENNFFYWKKEF
jgi:hypothetical protein